MSLKVHLGKIPICGYPCSQIQGFNLGGPNLNLNGPAQPKPKFRFGISGFGLRCWIELDIHGLSQIQYGLSIIRSSYIWSFFNLVWVWIGPKPDLTHTSCAHISRGFQRHFTFIENDLLMHYACLCLSLHLVSFLVKTQVGVYMNEYMMI